MSEAQQHEDALLHGSGYEEGREKDKNGEDGKAHVQRAFCAAFRSLYFLHTFSQGGAHERLKVGE